MWNKESIGNFKVPQKSILKQSSIYFSSGQGDRHTRDCATETWEQGACLIVPARVAILRGHLVSV